MSGRKLVGSLKGGYEIRVSTEAHTWTMKVMYRVSGAAAYRGMVCSSESPGEARRDLSASAIQQNALRVMTEAHTWTMRAK